MAYMTPSVLLTSLEYLIGPILMAHIPNLVTSTSVNH